MRDLYETLGVAPDASPQDIKKAYRKLALDAHPDKGGNAEKMGLLNEAYQTLLDPDKRKEFDMTWETYNATNVEEELSQTILADYLAAGNIQSYSDTYRHEHAEMVKKYGITPLTLTASQINQHRFCPNFVNISEMESLLRFPITPIVASKLLAACISGGYHDTSRLKNIKNYLSSQCNLIFAHTPKAPELGLYEGIKEIIFMLPKTPQEQRELIFSIKKITDFAKQTSDLLLLDLMPLFYNPFFRQLHAHALNLYWDAHEELLQQGDPRKLFNGYIETKDFLNILRERLSRESNTHLNELIQYLNLLFRFEKDLHDAEKNAKTAEAYREMAFHGLDWIPVFIEKSSKPLLLNLFLQIGILFQQASRIETESFERMMADEQLALKLYMTAVTIGHHATPDAEIYVNTQVIRYLSAFQFAGVMDNEIVTALKKRTATIVDMFPFFEVPQTNLSIFRQEGHSLRLMRQLLNAMLNAYEYNKTHSDEIPIHHTASNILYQAYEACLKNWYQEKYDPETEKKFRLDLMEELLFDNGWTFLDVEQQVDSPWIMVDRDEQGWMKPTRSLPYTEKDAFVKYRTINGAEVNHKTGEINFFMTPWTQDRPDYEKLFTLFDLQELLEKNISGAIFSLDPVDPDKPYHPYNLMRFAPSHLYESELLNTMLLTDYILKFLTTNQEIQGQHPFDQRPVDAMIRHVPEYLRQIINDFHDAQHAGALHRFWIEAEEIDVSISDEAGIQKDLTRISLGNLRMVVKKHRMERDIHGDLHDVGDEDEGWPIYVLTAQQMKQLQQRARTINGHAMIFIYAEQRVIFWEHNEIIKSHVPIDYRETLIRLFKQPKDQNGLITKNTTNMPLMYRATKEMTQQAGLPHRYSAEFIFAHKFTTHYDEFAQYLPEFGRLKELSKISSLIRILDGMRQSNKECTQALNYILSASPQTTPPVTDAYTRYSQAHEEMSQNIKNIFKTWSNSLATTVLQKKWRDELNKIKNEIGTLSFTRYSKEVNEECERQCDYSYRNSRGYSRAQIEKIIDEKRSDIASQFSTSKRASVRKQMMELFYSHLSLNSYACGQLIDEFMNGNINPLADALLEKEKTKNQEEIKKQFPNSSIGDIASALDNPNHPAMTRIATEESRRQLREQKMIKDKLETGFVNINLGTNEEPVDLEGKCLWVPASVRHDVKKDDATGLTRYSFFVYGGVSVQPRINVVQGQNGSLGGSPVGSGSFNRNNITKGFQDHHIASDKNRFTRDHELWKLSGVNTNSRANKIYLPTTAEQHQTRSIHSGRHTNSYSIAIAKKMDNLVKVGQKNNWNSSQYKEATKRMLSEVRQELRAGNVALNKNHRLGAKKW